MHRTTLVGSLRRCGTLTAAAFVVAVATAGPAAAHAEVEAEGARALDQNVALTFSAASESSSAGITKLEVILPKGIEPGDITYKEGPDGWKLAPTSRGYTVSGPKLAVGEDADHVVTVRQLPDAGSLVFKTLQTYSDDHVDRWIEEGDTSEDGHGHGHPAPRLELKPAAPGAKPVSPSPTEEPTTAVPSSDTVSGEPTTPPAAPPTQPTVDSAEDDDGMSAAVPLGIGAAVLLLGGGAWWFKSRRSGSS
ncbi:DUF1775 domain-containing protein [Streptomyces hirsutus]|uniref:DUF1775 domain-containing protein n=1 Tax=Streptomyces hirsutus TaxID=35620 RepID=A0ABZ1GZR1_9ACTN|nr:DUF1775 domain-containing protein [Streptomyces hirsutus]WSD11677.1 DUF1775 domain-containing protein [Streptomyces hirsutus]WTD22363.1 DUF1775 domain-containing protein [Streptomyces hirsutus]